MTAIRETASGVIIDVQVVPRASRVRFGPMVGEWVKVQLTAPPVEGAANDALIQMLAKSLRIPRRQVTILQGEHGRRKTVRIDGVSLAAVNMLLSEKL